ncbi:MAG: hypothetical protein ACOC93_01040 [Planctomycetota bacterium]
MRSVLIAMMLMAVAMALPACQDQPAGDEPNAAGVEGAAVQPEPPARGESNDQPQTEADSPAAQDAEAQADPRNASDPNEEVQAASDDASADRERQSDQAAQDDPQGDAGEASAQGNEQTDAENAAAEADQADAPDGMEKLLLELPSPKFKGTPTDFRGLEAPLLPPRKGPRPKLLVPADVKNLAAGKEVTSSDMQPVIGSLDLITDGDKEANEGSYVELGPGKQWVQVDLGQPAEIHAIVLWHYHADGRVYHDVVVQVAKDPDFIDVTTVFNNDHDNSSGLGMGDRKAYVDTHEGKLIDAKGTVGRYVRCYSNGSTANVMNHYTELEVYGRPVK